MPGRLGVIFTTTPQADPRTGTVRLIDTDTGQSLRIESLSLVLTLEVEPGATFARGWLRQAATGVQYPIQSSAALFEALAEYVARARSVG